MPLSYDPHPPKQSPPSPPKSTSPLVILLGVVATGGALYGASIAYEDHQSEAAGRVAARTAEVAQAEQHRREDTERAAQRARLEAMSTAEHLSAARAAVERGGPGLAEAREHLSYLGDAGTSAREVTRLQRDLSRAEAQQRAQADRDARRAAAEAETAGIANRMSYANNVVLPALTAIRVPVEDVAATGPRADVLQVTTVRCTNVFLSDIVSETMRQEYRSRGFVRVECRRPLTGRTWGVDLN